MPNYPSMPPAGTRYPLSYFDVPAAERLHVPSSAPHTNTYSFYANARGEALPEMDVNGTSSISRDIENSHTFPGYPIPQALNSFPYSQFSQVSTQAPPTKPTPSPSNTNSAPELSAQQRLARQQSPRSVNKVPSESDLEDGEVNDEGMEGSADLSGGNTTEAPVSQAVSKLENGEESGVLETSGKKNRLDEMNADPPQISEQQSSTQSHSLQQLHSNDYHNAEQNPSVPLMKHGTHELNASATGTEGHSPTDPKLLLTKSEEAKKALRDLHSRGLDFGQLLKRGMHSSILEMLYTEIGIPMNTSSSSLQQDAESKASVEAVVTSNNDAHGDLQRTSSMRDTSSGELGISQSGTKSSPLHPATGEQKILTLPATAAVPKIISSGNALPRTSAVKAADTKPLDRKEYIARMLAAKAGISTAPTKSPVSSNAPLHVSSETADQPHPPTATSASMFPTVEPDFRKSGLRPKKEALEVSTPSSRDESALDAKKKAQTDLARQKMEALKLQQESRKAVSKAAVPQVPLTSSSQSPALAPITVPRPTGSSRQNSYFSPVSQKAPFSIPGLFMTNEPPLPANGSNKVPSKADAASRQDILHPTPQLSTDVSTVAAQEPSVEVNKDTKLPSSVTPNTVQRKRQKASDFLDPPPTRVKKPLGQQEDSSVIIDISDEETAGVSDTENMDLEIATRGVTTSRKTQPESSHSVRQKNFQDHPPLSDFPSRRKTPAETPPVAPIPNQAKGLRTKEMEIELMNRKIAELEQRMNAKKTNSRAHTPKALGRATASPPFDQLSPSQEVTSGTTKETPVKSTDDTPGGIPGDPSIAAIEEAYNHDTERELHDVEMAKAKAERSLAVDIAKASTEDLSLLDEQSQDVIEEKPQGLGRSTRKPREPQLDEAPQPQFIDDKPPPAQQDEVRMLNEESINPPPDPKTRHGGLQESVHQNLSDAQRQQRRLAIENGLPVLDATVEKTKQKLESLRREVESLELEVRKGLEGRKALVEELNILSNVFEAQHSLNSPQNELDGHQVKQSLSTSTNAALRKITSPIEVIDDSPSPQPPMAEIVSSLQERDTSSQNAARDTSPSSQAADKHPRNEELEGDVMDLCGSEMDDGEFSTYSPKLSNTGQQQIADLDDDGDRYQPPTDVSVLQLQEQDHSTPLVSGERFTSDEPTGASQSSGTNLQEAGSADATDRPMLDADMQLDPLPGPIVTDGSDPDDYEPPEPAALTPDSGLHSRIMNAGPAVDNDASLTGSDSPSELTRPRSTVKTIESFVDAEKKAEPTPQPQHFFPYESPLKQFKSFRNHPEYLNEASQGFRSLTYSNAVKTDVPMCRYELDGVCNDASCDSQHFKSIGLSDEKILVDLGTLPKRSDIASLDATAYTDGLRKLIQDIRKRKVRDVNEVASEISAYRRQFLGDFRILSL